MEPWNINIWPVNDKVVVRCGRGEANEVGQIIGSSQAFREKYDRLSSLNRELVEALERMDRTLWTGYADPVREFKKAVSAALAKARKEG